MRIGECRLRLLRQRLDERIEARLRCGLLLRRLRCGWSRCRHRRSGRRSRSCRRHRPPAALVRMDAAALACRRHGRDLVAFRLRDDIDAALALCCRLPLRRFLLLRRFRRVLDGGRHFDDFPRIETEDAAFTVFLCMQDDGIRAEFCLDLLHGFLHRLGLVHFDLQLDLHHP